MPNHSVSPVFVRCANGFFVRGGIVNPGEIVQLTQGEAREVIVTNRGELVTSADAAKGPMADFKPKDES